MRSISLTALQSSLAQEVEEVFLCALVIEHEDLDEPLKLVNDRQDLVRADGTYKAMGFKLSLNSDEEDNITLAELVVPILDYNVVRAIRATDTPFTVTISVVTASSPNTVEIGPLEFESVSADVSGSFVTIGLGFHRNLFSDVFPKGIFSPSNAVDV